MRFASRTSWPRRPNALTVAAAAARSDPKLIDLTISNPTRVGLVYPEQTIRAASSDPAALLYTPTAAGALETRAAIARYYGRRGVDIDPARIQLTASTSEAYGFLFRLLTDPGDSVLAPLPSYPLFEYLTGLGDVQRHPYRLRYDGAWYLDAATLIAAERCRAILTVGPNNPTGSVLDPAGAAAIVDLARDHDLAIISDEVFADYGVEHRTATWIDRCDRLSFSLNGLSKVAGLPQLKLAWIVVSGPDDLVGEALARLEIIGDTYLSVSTPAQLAATRILDGVDAWQAILQERIERNRQRLAEALVGSPCTRRRGDGGWSAMIDLPATRTDEAWALSLLEHRRVLVHPGYLFDLDAGTCAVLSLIGAPERFDEGLTRLLEHVVDDVKPR